MACATGVRCHRKHSDFLATIAMEEPECSKSAYLPVMIEHVPPVRCSQSVPQQRLEHSPWRPRAERGSGTGRLDNLRHTVVALSVRYVRCLLGDASRNNEKDDSMLKHLSNDATGTIHAHGGDSHQPAARSAR